MLTRLVAPSACECHLASRLPVADACAKPICLVGSASLANEELGRRLRLKEKFGAGVRAPYTERESLRAVSSGRQE